MILHHDNSQHHNAKVTKAAILDLGWEILVHPTYSPDLAASDFHLLRSLSNQMRGVTFKNDEDFKSWLDNYFASSKGDFWRNGFDNLVKRWEEVLKNCGDHIVD